MAHTNHTNGKVKSPVVVVPVQSQANVTDNDLEDDNVASHNNSNDALQINLNDVLKEDVREASLDNAATKSSSKNPWQTLSLRTKATLLAIVIGVVPVFGVGTIAYFSARHSIAKQIAETKTSRVNGLADKVNRFMYDHYNELQTLGHVPSFINPKLRETTSSQEKQLFLNQVVKTSLIYDSIALIDTNGSVIAQAGELLPPNYSFKGIDYFEEVLKTGQPVITQPRKSKVTKALSFFMSVPVKDSVTGRTVAVLRARTRGNALKELIKSYGSAGDSYHLISPTGKIFADSNNNSLDKNVAGVFPSFSQLQSVGKPNAMFGVGTDTNKEQVIAYAPTQHLEGLPDLKWSAIMNIDTATAFAAQQSFLLAITLGSAVTALLVGTIAAYLARRATQPILDAAGVVEKLGQGELETRIAVAGEDELATLGSNINQMAEQIQTLLVEQEQAAQQQLSAQTEIARQQTEFALQQKQQNEALQQELLHLLSGVEAASSGDLTVRAEISAGEIGIVADFFNSIVESLRDVVTQVKQSTTQVNAALGEDEGAMRQLADESMRQAKGIERLLDSVEAMSRSIQEVAANANLAAQVARVASSTAQAGGAAMDDTVQSILHLRETVAETAKKVKRLGESSQQISKVISLINQIALQTNLLAINASIEAARAGEEGRGFAVVAEEVGELAARSAAATKEIEQIVEKIQLETNEVVSAMETGTAQVVEGTNLVANAKKSLEQIMDVSNQIDQLVQSISTATVSQASTSQSMTHLMKEVAEVSERTSEFSRQISSSLQQTVEVARQLQGSVDTFKVEAA
ncbi:MAG: methyl-accepting chemotaxis protein [Chroococcidiopsidaceae cyanobacterium CP_BM_ER_R8_30]|nr:methyl-accepting chemotaxis protein [Chroococcidiopsidaceae cyanobacterium CP_BM_ER_R8_30]